MTGYYTKDAKCPFYRSDDGRSKISCEGLADTEGCRILLFFDRKEDFLVQMQTFCCRHFKNCEVHAAITAAKYAEEEET